MTSSHSFCVVMPTRGRPELAIRALSSVIPQLADPDSLLVVDNGSSPEHVARLDEWLAEHCLNARLVREDRPGVSHARSRALSEATATIVCFIDDDVRVCEGWLGALKEAWQTAEGSVAAIGGPMRADWQAPRPPWLLDQSLSILSILELGPERQRLHQQPLTGYLWGGNMSFRREAALAAGGFRPDQVYLEKIRPATTQSRITTARSGEEEELQRRLALQGWEVWYEPRAAVDHLIPVERTTPTFFRDYYRQLGLFDAVRDRHKVHAVVALARGLARYVIFTALRRPDAYMSRFYIARAWAHLRGV
jgi:glycosyltransferase involved in cell wall biosynthesis